MRSGRSHILGLRSEDPVLNSIGPIGLGLAFGSALIVDLVGESPGRTLAEIRDEGPRLVELSPGRGGVATIAAGPLTGPELLEAIEVMDSSWPAIVVRSDGHRWAGPTVPYRGAYPGMPGLGDDAPAVWQIAQGARHQSLQGVVLPRIGRRATMTMLAGRIPRAPAWIAAWRTVWGMPWA